MTETESAPPREPEGSDPGAVLGGRYRLRRELGRGATGVVWEAMDLRGQQPVAVKVLHAHLLSSPAARRRFRREVATARALDHSGLVRVEDNGQAPDGREYLVMELLGGRTFSALLAESAPLPQAHAIRIIARILDAVAAAHRANVVHRDLKPGNVMLLPGDEGEGRIKVCDFGLAKAFDPLDGDGPEGERAHPVSGPSGQAELLGTPEYMAPEQARGEPLDGRADLYAIAAMLFHAVVGEPPFRGRTPLAVVSLHLSAPPPAPSALRPDLAIAPAMEKLILRGLAKDPRERPSSAEVFRADLLQIEKDLLRDQRGGARRRPVPSAGSLTLAGEPARRPVLPRRWVWLLAGALGVGGGAVAVWRGVRAPPTVQSLAPGVVSSAMSTTFAGDRGSTAAGGAFSPPPPVRKEAAAATATASAAEVPRAARSARPPTERVAHHTARPEHAAPPATPPAEQVLDQAEDLLASGQPAHACELGEQAAGRAPTLARAHSFLGRCYMRIGVKDRARLHYRRYLELAPGAADAPFVTAILDGQPDAAR